MAIDIYINTDRPADRSVVEGTNSPNKDVSLQAITAGTQPTVNLYAIKNDGTYDSLSGDPSVAVSFEINREDGSPVQGNYTLTDGVSTTGNIPYNASAAYIEGVLNKLNTNTGPNGTLVNVAKIAEGQYVVTFRENGAQTLMTGTAVTLYPNSNITTETTIIGDGSTQAQQTISLDSIAAISQGSWKEVANGFSAKIDAETEGFSQAVSLDKNNYILEIKLNQVVVCRKRIALNESELPEDSDAYLIDLDKTPVLINNNLYFIDTVAGNDATGKANNHALPYKTIGKVLESYIGGVIYVNGKPYENLVKKDAPTDFNTAWNGSIPINNYTDGERIVTDFEASDYEVAGGTIYYVDYENGDNANDGLTESTAKKEVLSAHSAAAEGDTIICLEGNHIRPIQTGSLTKGLTIKAKAGANVKWFGTYDNSWSLTSGQSNTYEQSRTQAVDAVFDMTQLDSDGLPQYYSTQSSIATVEANEGSFWHDSGNNLLYVHRVGATAPINYEIIAPNENDLFRWVPAQTDSNLYVEGIEFIGGRKSVGIVGPASSTNRAVFKNCSFKHTRNSTDRNGVDVDGTAKVYLQNCLSIDHEDDAFNYHALNSVVPDAIEVCCTASHIGDSSDTNRNASSMHDSGNIIRVNCHYSKSGGPIIAESSGLSWNLGCKVHSSLQTGTSGRGVDSSGTSAEVWLDGCHVYGCDQGLYANTGNSIHRRNTRFEGISSDTNGGGTNDKY